MTDKARLLFPILKEYSVTIMYSLHTTSQGVGILRLPATSAYSGMDKHQCHISTKPVHAWRIIKIKKIFTFCSRSIVKLAEPCKPYGRSFLEFCSTPLSILNSKHV